jgi:hypothetical protein
MTVNQNIQKFPPFYFFLTPLYPLGGIVWFLTMEAPYLLLVFLLCAGFVSGQRLRSRILRERLYLETLANQTGMTYTTALNALVTKPLETTTATPTP